MFFFGCRYCMSSFFFENMFKKNNRKRVCRNNTKKTRQSQVASIDWFQWKKWKVWIKNSHGFVSHSKRFSPSFRFQIGSQGIIEKGYLRIHHSEYGSLYSIGWWMIHHHKQFRIIQRSVGFVVVVGFYFWHDVFLMGLEQISAFIHQLIHYQ